MSALRIRFRHLLSLAQVEWHIKFTKVPFEATSSCNSKLQSAMIISPWSSKSTSPDCMVTVYALTFAGLNFRGFRGSIAIRESLHQTGNACAIASQTAKIKTWKPRKLVIHESLTPWKLKRIRYIFIGNSPTEYFWNKWYQFTWCTSHWHLESIAAFIIRISNWLIHESWRMLALDLRALYYCLGVWIVQSKYPKHPGVYKRQWRERKERLSTLARNEIHLTKQVTICSLTNA